MARVFNEAAWKSDKVLGIKPAEWIPEYSWLYSIALVDGTFEASPRQLWMAAYVGRPDWNPDKVSLLLDELDRVGLLQRATDENGKVWGRWVGSERFLPSKEHVDSHRYKKGRPDLFRQRSADAARQQSSVALDSPEQRQNSAGESRLGVGLEVEVELGKGEGRGVDLVCAHGSENEKPAKAKTASLPSSLQTPTATATAAPTPLPFKRIRTAAIPATDDREQQRVDSSVAEWAAELAARPSCPGCGGKHPDPSPACTLASTTMRKNDGTKFSLLRPLTTG
jgi:hypothetical protein